MTNVIHFRDYVEDLVSVNTSKLVSAIKSTSDVSLRVSYCLAFLHEHFALQKYNLDDTKFVEFAINQELDKFFEIARSIIRFRPVLKNSRETLEAVLQSFTKCPTVESFVDLSKKLKHSNIWPCLALYVSHLRGEAEEYFLHCPMPRIFGSTSGMRNAIEKASNIEKLLVKSASLSIQNVVLGSHSSICYKTLHRDKFCAYLVYTPIWANYGEILVLIKKR